MHARYIFISYDTSEVQIADFIKGCLTRRVPAGVSVFIAKRDISAGENPLKRMLEEELQQAEALVALCSKSSKRSPWLWWEAGSVWARRGLVVPIFVNCSPKEFDGPLTLVAQGRTLFDLEELTSALQTVCSLFDPAVTVKMTTAEESQLDTIQQTLKE